MANQQSEIGGSESLMTALAVPRPLSRIFLAAACIGVGQLAWMFMNAALLAFTSGQAVAGATLCLAAVWSFREKTADVFNDVELSSADLRMTQRAVLALGGKTIRRSIWTGFCVLLAAMPAASLQLAGFIMQWMVLLGAFGVAEAFYSFWLTSHLSQQVQEWRDNKKFELLEAKEQQAQLERLQNSVALDGWKDRAVQAEQRTSISGSLQRVG